MKLILGFLLVGAHAMATEHAPFTVEKHFEKFEVRAYPELLVAETTVESARDDASNLGFRLLANYIFGGNRGSKKIAMTAPVTQTAGQKIAMTAPVTQTATAPNRWVIQFTMPAEFTLQTLPEPVDSRVTIRAMPARKIAVQKYSGVWSEALYNQELQKLRDELQAAGLTPRGEPTWARYDPPWMPWFMRTNEIQLELEP